jgi:plastocyanin
MFSATGLALVLGIAALAPASASATPTPTTFVVNKTDDSTSGATPPTYTLATAIIAANADPGSTIEFATSISSDTITKYALPTITAPVTIDGCSIPGQAVLPDSQCAPGATVNLGSGFPVSGQYPNTPGNDNTGSSIFEVRAANVTIRGLNIKDSVNLPVDVDANSGFAKDFTFKDSTITTGAVDGIDLGGDAALIGGLGTPAADTLNSKDNGGGDGNVITMNSNGYREIDIFNGTGDRILGNQLDVNGNDTGVQIDGGDGTQLIADSFLQGDGGENGVGLEVNAGQDTEVGQPGNADPQTSESLIAPANDFGSGFGQPIVLNDSGSKLANMASIFQAIGSDGDGAPFITFQSGDENHGVHTPKITSATSDAIFGTADKNAEITVVAASGHNNTSVNSIVAEGSTDTQGNYAIPFEQPVSVGSYLNVYETVPGIGSSRLAVAVVAASPPVAAFQFSAPNDTDPANGKLRPVRPGQTVSFDASSSHNVANTGESYTWDWGDGTAASPDTQTTAGPTASHTYANAGTYKVQLLLTDTTAAGPEESVTTQTLTVAPDESPIPVVQSPGRGVFNSSIAFDGSNSYDPDGKITNYQVTVVDSNGQPVAGDTYNKSTPPSKIDVPAQLGTYQATMTVTDDEGATASQTVPLTAVNPPPPPSTPAPVKPVGTPPSSALDKGQSNMLAAEQQAVTSGGQPIPVACGTDTPKLGSCVSGTQLTESAIDGHNFAAIGGSPDITIDSSGSIAGTKVKAGSNGNLEIDYTAPDLNLNGVSIQPATAGKGSLAIVTDLFNGRLNYIGLSSGTDAFVVTFDGMRLYQGPIDWSIFGPGSSSSAPANGFKTQFNNIPGLSGFDSKIGVNNSYNSASPTLNGLAVTTFTPFSFAGGQANTNVTNQLPSALGEPGADGQDGSGDGPTSPNSVSISNDSVAQAIGTAEMLASSGDSLLGEAPSDLFGGSGDPIGLSVGNANAAGGACASRLNGTLPTGKDAVTIGFPDADLGGIPLSGVQLTIDGPSHFILEATAGLPTGDVTLHAMVEISNGAFRFGCAEATFADPGIELGTTPVFLTGINLGVLDAGTQWVINGGAQFTAGPEEFGQALLQADIQATAVFPGSTAPPGTPWGFQLDGNIKLLPGVCPNGGDESSDPVDCGFTADANLLYVSTGLFRGSVTLDISLGPVTLNGGIGGVLLPNGDWDVDGHLTLGYPAFSVGPLNVDAGTVGADVNLADQQGQTSVSFCAKIGGFSVSDSATLNPFDLSFPPSLGCSLGVPSEFAEPTCSSLQSTVDTLQSKNPTPGSDDATTLGTDETLLELGPPGGCTDSSASTSAATRSTSGTSGVRAAPTRARTLQRATNLQSSSSSTSRAATTATPLNPGQAEAFEVTNSGAIEKVVATGQSAPPVIDVITPNGVDYPSGQYGTEDVTKDTTTIYVTKASDEVAGAWNVVVDSGSSPVTDLTEQENMDATVTGSVSNVGDRTEELAYNAQIPDGTQVQFTEVGSDSDTVIGAVGPGSGTLDWTIANGSAGTRTVEAHVINGDGTITYSNDAVDTFTAPDPELPSALTGVSLTSDGNGGAKLSYQPDALTQTVIAVVTDSDGRVFNYSEPAGTNSIDIPNIAPGSSLTATVYGKDAQDRTGPPSSATATIGSAQNTSIQPPNVIETKVAPSISGLKQSKSRWMAGKGLPKESSGATGAQAKKSKTGTVFSFSLNTDATVQLAFTQPLKGFRVGHKCEAVKPRKHGKKKPRRCSTTKTLGTLSYSLTAGPYQVSVQGQITRRVKLAPGKYTLVVTASNADGKTTAHPLNFTVLKPSHHKKKKKKR